MRKGKGSDTQGEASVREWLVRLRSGDATTEDAEAFRRWCAEHPDEARFVPTMGQIWGKLGVAASEVMAEQSAAARAAEMRAGAAHVSRRRAVIGFAVAAGATWLAVRPPLQLWPALGDFVADYRTGTGEQRKVVLSDRVTVQMNTQTRIDVLSASGETGAIKLLAGEAEVIATGSPGGAGSNGAFTVVAGRGRMTARAARFDIRRSGDEVCVTCMSGSLTFAHPRQQQPLTLNVAQQLTYDDRHVRAIVPANTATVTAWRRGVLVFDDVALSRVVDEINRYRPGKVIVRNAALGARSVHAKFFIAKLDDAIDMIGDLYGARVTRLPGGITVLG